MDKFLNIKNGVLIFLRKSLGQFHAFIWGIGPVRKALTPFVYEPKNKELKNIHLGKRAFIIGNGPSILKQDLTLLKNEVTFVLNDFFLHPQLHEINPTYLCSCDPFLIVPKRRLRWYRLHEKYDTTKITMLFKKSAEKIDKKYGLFKKHKVYYLRAASMLLPPLSSIKYCPTDITMPLSGHFLVMIDIALMSAYYMGIKEVYLLGFDGQLIKSFKDYLYYDFYGKHPLMTVEESRRDYKFYLSGAYKRSRTNLHDQTIACIKRTFAKRGMKIYNATYNKGNFIGFDYINYEDIISKKGS